MIKSHKFVLKARSDHWGVDDLEAAKEIVMPSGNVSTMPAGGTIVLVTTFRTYTQRHLREPDPGYPAPVLLHLDSL